MIISQDDRWHKSGEGLVLGREVGVGLKLLCPHCDAELEVLSIDPLELDWAYDWTWEEEEEAGHR